MNKFNISKFSFRTKKKLVESAVCAYISSFVVSNRIREKFYTTRREKTKDNRIKIMVPTGDKKADGSSMTRNFVNAV